MQNTMTSQSTSINDYNYETFSAKLYTLDAFKGPKPGDKAIDFTATTLDGRSVNLSDYFGKPIVLETGSISCPQYVSRISGMNQLAGEYPEFEFLLLYVREAHPGDKLGSHQSADDKHNMADRLRQEERENRTILIDTMNGQAHQAYGSLPNMLFVIDADGVVAFRTDWNDVQYVRPVLDKMREQQSVADMQYGFKPVGPHVLFRVLYRSGWDALWDFFTSLPALIRGHIKAEQKTK